MGKSVAGAGPSSFRFHYSQRACGGLILLLGEIDKEILWVAALLRKSKDGSSRDYRGNSRLHCFGNRFDTEHGIVYNIFMKI